jgi:hypothetical protein
VQLTAVLALNNAGAVHCDGGSATSGTGGEGGDVTLFGARTAVVNTSTNSAVGGPGASIGTAGRVTIDGVVQ